MAGISYLVRADGLESVSKAVSVFVAPHEHQKRIAIDNGDLRIDEKPTTWYQSAPGTAKSKLVMFLS